MDRETKAAVASPRPESGWHVAHWSVPEFVLLAVLALVALMWTQATVKPGAVPPRRDAIAQLSWLSGIVRQYWRDERTLPQTLERLTLPSGPDGYPSLEILPLDPWHHAFGYAILDERATEFELRSAGEDGRMGTEDDVVSVERAHSPRPR